ncbi:MAG: hypothetical protein H0V60_01355 [Actinobacteria bacterium]|nr:hypothetical protein [Actinomycetota bacterium]
MDILHRYVGFAIPAGFAVMWLWAIYAFVRNRDPGGGYWILLAALQVVIGIQLVVGTALFATGARPQSNGPSWLHYVYGAAFPALMLILAHRYAKRVTRFPWAVFAVAAFLNSASTFRALQTGLGLD